MTENRGRGRPKGTGINDEADLIRVAEILLANPKFKPTTAMRKHIKDNEMPVNGDPARIRRWQEKWKSDSALYLGAARARQEERAVRTIVRGASRAVVDRSSRTVPINAIEQLRRLAAPPHSTINEFLQNTEISRIQDALKRLSEPLFKDPISEALKQLMEPQERMRRLAEIGNAFRLHERE